MNSSQLVAESVATLDEVSLVFGASSSKGRAVLALDRVSIDIREGEFVAVVGPSGCGKTTILNMLSGLISQSAGTVERFGAPVAGPSRRIGYMLARSALYPWRSARKNVEFGLELRGMGREHRHETAQALLESLGLGDFGDAYPSELSQGMRQRVAIARTLAIDPDLWLMDEPFGALDAQTRLEVQSEFLGVWEATSSSVIFVTHDLSEAVLLADRVLVMTARPGRIKANIPIDLPRPRDIAQIRFEERFLELEEQVWKELRDEL